MYNKLKGKINVDAWNHWRYSEGIIKNLTGEDISLRLYELMGYLYTEAYKHGYKHAYDDIPKLLPHCLGGVCETCYDSSPDTDKTCEYVKLCERIERESKTKPENINVDSIKKFYDYLGVDMNKYKIVMDNKYQLRVRERESTS